MSLPLCDEQVPAASSPGGEANAAEVAKHRVLIADDNRDAADSLAAFLALVGHEMRVAYDGNAALATAREFRPDMAVLDIDMPGLDGYAVAEALRLESWAEHLSIVALTGLGDEENARRAEIAGFDAHLIKPVEPDRINALLRDQRKAGTSRAGAAAEHPVGQKSHAGNGLR